MSGKVGSLPAGQPNNGMKGFYVYCIRHGADEKKIRIKGVEFGGKILMISFKDIEAIVSDIDLSQFNEEKIRNKLQEDQKWTEKNIRCHHDVIAKAYETGTVAPMKFGTIFKTKKSLEAMLKKYYRKFKELLAELSGKQEWGVKGYFEYKKFAEILKNKNKEIQKLEKKRSSVPEGMKWYMERKADELIAGRIECEVEDELQKIINKIEKYAKEIRFNDLLPKEIGEPAKDMILNAACLVRNDALDKFQAMFQGLLRECESLGIILTLTGPWPPYNFVDIKK